MKKVYIVFDKIPTKRDGGLVATYVDFVSELQDTYDIAFVSIFRSPATDIDAFRDIPVITLLDTDIDNRFYKLPNYLISGNIRKTLECIRSFLVFFCTIPYIRHRTRFLFSGGVVIAPAPASGIFINAHTPYLLEVHTNYEYFWGRNILGRLQTLLMTRPSLTIFRNKADADKGEKYFPSTYLYNTINANNSVLEMKSPNSRHNALFVGRLVDQKNPLLLVDITKEVLKQVSDFELDIYGTGELKDKLLRKIQLEHLEEHIHYRGFTDDKNVYEHYDCLWLTSVIEGFGLVIVEAAARSTPCVTTNWGDASREIVLDGKTGFVAESIEEFANDAVLLMTNNGLRNRMGHAARLDYENRFSSEIHKQRWIELIERMPTA